jgi:glycosyltransferase involved in cell wall biosynthesis
MIDLPFSYTDSRPMVPSVEWLTSPAKPALQVASALDRVRRAPTILAALRSVPAALDVTTATVRDGVPTAAVLAPILEAIDDGRDTVTALAAVHALGRVPGPAGDIELLALILHGSPGFEAHAIWAMATRAASTELVRPLARAVARGGMPGMHAQRVLAQWARSHGRMVLAALESTLHETTSPDARRYLVETVGLLPLRDASLTLRRVAADTGESRPVRDAAISAFIDRLAEPLPGDIVQLGRVDDSIGEAVRSVRAQRRLRKRGPRRDPRRSRGIRVAQIHLAAILDPASSHAGAGDAGGVATLLAQLGSSLAEQPRVSEVISIGRGRPDERLPSTDVGPGRRHERIPLLRDEGATFFSGWPSVAAATRGIRSAFLASYLPDVVHLRMADPGSLAGASVARELGIPFVFSLAPDPHASMAMTEATGKLERSSFAAADARGALWFRANLVERLARDARELVLFPRARLRTELRDLTGIDIGDGPPNHTVVPEGIDLARTERARSTIREAGAMPAVVSDLQRAISALPKVRHGLPLVISVGRMHEVKGMARLVEAFAIDTSLATRANLVIVGGDLERPSAAESAELSRIKQLFDRHRGLAQRVVLLGHRPNDEVSLLLATARQGWGTVIGAAGAYACGSAKEEFGLAIIEAMAAGLPVVAPQHGGPATYVEDGVTGRLVDATDSSALAAAVHTALDLSSDPSVALRSRSVVEERFTLERMARTLAAIYRTSAGASTLALAVRGADQPTQ